MFKGKLRFWMVGWLFCLVALAIMDRVNMGIAAPLIMKELSIPAGSMGIIMSAFTLGYAISNFPAGFFIQKYSCRRVMVGIVGFWSVMTIMTGFAGSFVSLLIIRVLFGIGEGPIAPTNTAIINNWMLPKERGLASGMWLTAVPVGTIFGSIFSAGLATHYGWRWIFFVFGFAGFIFMFLSWFIVRDRPSEHNACTTAEREKIEKAIEEYSGSKTDDDDKAPGMTFMQLITNKVGWMVFGIFFVLYCFIWANVNWMPTYFMKTRGVSLMTSGYYTSIPWVCAILGPLSIGWLSDHSKMERSVWIALSLFLAVPAIIVAINIQSVIGCLAGFSIATYLCYGSISVLFTIPMEMFKGSDVGKIAGMMLSGSSLGGMTGAILVGYVLEYTGSFNMAYYTFCSFAFIGGCIALALWRKEKAMHLSRRTLPIAA